RCIEVHEAGDLLVRLVPEQEERVWLVERPLFGERRAWPDLRARAAIGVVVAVHFERELRTGAGVLGHPEDAEDVAGLVAGAGARPVIEERGYDAGLRAGRGRVSRARLGDELLDRHLDEQQREAPRIVQAEAETSTVDGARVGARAPERPESQIELAVLDGTERVSIDDPRRPR